MGLWERYLQDAGGDRVEAATAIAFGLMKDEPEKYKAGYTAENALLAVTQLAGLTTEEQELVGQELVGENIDADLSVIR